MRRILFILQTFLPLLLTAQVNITPAYPQRGENITITYRPVPQGPVDQKNIPVLIFTYSNLYELPYKIPLTRSADTWTTSFLLARYASFATFYIQDGEKKITPETGGHFELAVYKADHTPVKNGYLYKAYSLSAQKGRTPALAKEQADLYHSELQAYPDNYEARVRLFQYEIDHASNQQEKEDQRKKAHDFIAARFASDPGNMNNLNSVTMAYLILGENSRVDSIRQVVITRYPQSTAGIELITGIIAKEKDTAVMIGRFEKELKDETPATRNAYADMHEHLFHYYALHHDAAKALPHARAMLPENSPYLPESLLDITHTLALNELAPDTALAYAKKSLQAADSFPAGIIRYWPETGFIPGYVADSVRQAAIRKAKANILALTSLIYITKNDQSAATQNADDAIALSQDVQTLQTAASAYEKLARYEKAYRAWRQWILQSPGIDTTMLAKAKSDYLHWKGNDEQWPKEYSSIQTEKRTNLISLLQQQRLNIKAPTLDSIVDLSGKAVSPASLKGKVVVIDFWATWCVPCMQEMPYLQKVYDKYKDNPRVAFMVINSGARNTLQDARNWFGNKKYSFPVYFHTNPAVGDHFGFNVIPAVYVIDGQGRLQFKTIGFEGAQMEDKLAAEIEVSLENK